jgi:hypothetical protein
VTLVATSLSTTCTLRAVLACLAGLLLVGWLSGCGPNLYELPDPPPRDEWRRHSLNPADDEVVYLQNFLSAKDTVLTFVEALEDERWEDAYRLLSNETRLLLDDLSPSGRGETVLENGRIQRGDNEYLVDALDLFVIRDLVDIVDQHDREREAETYRRKEIYAVDSNGEAHHIVVIYEEGGWRIHKPEIDLTPGAPGRRTLSSSRSAGGPG